MQKQPLFLGRWEAGRGQVGEGMLVVPCVSMWLCLPALPMLPVPEKTLPGHVFCTYLLKLLHHTSYLHLASIFLAFSFVKKINLLLDDGVRNPADLCCNRAFTVL